MESRMDKYNNIDDELPKRSEKHKDLYTQVYNAYDEFENLVVPSNSKEIDINDIQKEITKREDYHKIKDYKETTLNEKTEEPIVLIEEKQDDVVLDIKEMLNKAVLENQKVNEPSKNTATNAYLKKLNLDDLRVEESSEDTTDKEEYSENEELLKTANFSLDLLSDLKGDNDDTMITPPIKDELLEEDDDLIEYRDGNIELEETKEEHIENDDFYDNEMDSSSSVPFFKILGIVFGLILLIVATIYLYSYVTNAM